MESAGRENIFRELINGYHTLIGGTTGSGKSVFVAGLLNELIKEPRNQFILIDPKMVDLRDYAKLPQCISYATSSNEIRAAFQYAIDAMYDRYDDLASEGKRKYTETDGTLYIVIDEMADLLSVSSTKKWATEAIQTIAMKGRAARVLLISCTQSPSRAVIPAAVILNFANRVALHCNDTIESIQMLGHGHTEAVDLPLYGKAIIKTPETEMHTVTVPNTSEEAVRAAVAAYRTRATTNYAFSSYMDDEEEEMEEIAVAEKSTKRNSSFRISNKLVPYIVGIIVFIIVYLYLRSH